MCFLWQTQCGALVLLPLPRSALGVPSSIPQARAARSIISIRPRLARKVSCGAAASQEGLDHIFAGH